MRNSKFRGLILSGALFISSFTTFASSPQSLDTSNPIYINYILNQVEDKLEESLDKQYKVDWDFEISYNNGIVSLIIEYDKDDIKSFNKVSKEQLSELVTTISKDILKAIGKEVPIEGVIKEDNTNKVKYTFSYKNGKLDIK